MTQSQPDSPGQGHSAANNHTKGALACFQAFVKPAGGCWQGRRPQATGDPAHPGAHSLPPGPRGQSSGPAGGSQEAASPWDTCTNLHLSPSWENTGPPAPGSSSIFGGQTLQTLLRASFPFARASHLTKGKIRKPHCHRV